MGRSSIVAILSLMTALIGARYAVAGQAPYAASDPDIPISHQDRVYSAEQYSNTVSVTDPVDNKLLGTIRLGDPLPANLSPLYKGQLLVHGMGFSPDHRTIAVVAIGSNAVNFIDTATNSVKHIAYVGRSPHEAFFTMDGSEVWVVVRGENYVSVLDGTTYEEKTRITVPNGPGMTIFSPDGKYGYVCSSFTPETEVITVADHKIVGRVPQASPFCPNIAATPDSKQVFPTGKLPHGIWPSGDGRRVYVGLENEDKVAAIDTLKNEVIATSPVGQAPQALVYVPNAVPAASGATNSAVTSNLQPLGVAGQSAQLWLAPPGAKKEDKAPTSVSLSDQGLVQVLQAAVTGLEPGKPYLLALATEPSGTGVLEPLQSFMTNPAGAAVVNAIGLIRQVVRGEDKIPRRYLVILPGTPNNHGAAVQVQRE